MILRKASNTTMDKMRALTPHTRNSWCIRQIKTGTLELEPNQSHSNQTANLSLAKQKGSLLKCKMPIIAQIV